MASSNAMNGDAGADDEMLGHAEADAPLPHDAEHVAQPIPPEALNPEEVDAYITSVATKVNLLGMDLWKQSFPDPNDEEYYHNPKDLPTFWGIAPEDFDPRVLSDIISRHRRAMLLLHPDKHPSASLPLKKKLEMLCMLVNDAKDRVEAYLLSMQRGAVRVPPKAKGIYFQEVPEAFQTFLATWAAGNTKEWSGTCPTHLFLQTSDTAYLQLGVGGFGGSVLGAALPMEAARAFYEELLQPDDLPDDPKPLLVEMIHKYTLMAENLPPESTPTFRKEYAVLIGLPFLPHGEFVHWPKENLVMAAAVLQIKVEITVLLYAEAWPVAWGRALTFWGSRLMSDPELSSLICDVSFFNPPVKTFLKAGHSGIPLLKKVAAVRLSSHDEGRKEEDHQKFLEWRPSLIPPFLKMEKLYVEFSKADEWAMRRVLQVIARKLHLLVNGGGRLYPFRSFGDSREDKRRRLFLSRAPGNNSELHEVLQAVKNELRAKLLRAQVGWEHLFQIPPGTLIVTCSDLKFTYLPAFLALVDQVIIISRFKIAVATKADTGTRALIDFLQAYNIDCPRNQVKKIIASDGTLLANLIKQREIMYQQRRQRHMPPPGAWDLDGELEGVEPSRMENMIEEVLQGIHRFFRQGGFTEPPIAFSLPKAYFLWTANRR